MVFIPKPVLHLKMEGNADDSSGYDNHGTVTDATSTDNRWGNPNSAYNFNGTSAFIDCGNDSSLNITGNITIIAWIKANSFGTHSRIIENDFSTGYSFAISASHLGTNHLLFAPGDGSWNGSNDNCIILNKYQQIVVVRNGSIVNFYVNGINVGTNTGIATGVVGTNVVTKIGKGILIYHFDGIIDNIHVYNVAFTPTQVAYLYDKTKRKYGR